MNIRILWAVIVLCCCNEIVAQPVDSVRKYIDSALYYMQTKALNAKEVNWKMVRDSAYGKGSGAQTYKDAFPAIAYSFRQLKDYHGMVANEDTFYRYPPPVNFAEVLGPGIKKEFLKGQRIVTAFLGGSIAYLRVPGMNVTRQKDMDERANKLRDSLCMLVDKRPGGIIIDLRMNTGGNVAPMLSGLGPLFHISMLGYGVDREGNFMDPVRLDNGVLLNEKGNKMVAVEKTCSVNKKTPVAVLIGPSTVSSGEILAVYLKQQANVKLFGAPTPGFCNATEGFYFMNSQGYLLLTVNRIANARKQVNNEMRVRPDVTVNSNDNYENISVDPTVSAAMQWLNQRIKK